MAAQRLPDSGSAEVGGVVNRRERALPSPTSLRAKTAGTRWCLIGASEYRCATMHHPRLSVLCHGGTLSAVTPGDRRLRKGGIGGGWDMSLFPTSINAGKVLQHSLLWHGGGYSAKPRWRWGNPENGAPARPVPIRRSVSSRYCCCAEVCCMAHAAGMLYALMLPVGITCPSRNDAAGSVAASDATARR